MLCESIDCEINTCRVIALALSLACVCSAADAQKATPETRQVVGVWHETTGFRRKITIYVRAGRTYCDELFQDGSKGTVELVTEKVNGGMRFVEKNITASNREVQSHWFLGPSKRLKMRDGEGTYGIAEPVKALP